MSADYHSGSLRSLKEEEQVRERPSVIFGTADEYGAAHGVYEIIANSVDEATEGYGKSIRVKIEQDGTVTVSDDGRGVPMGWNESEGKYDWELVFRTLYASGKYDLDNYTQSAGLNGLGATAMQYASEFMDVESTYGGKTYIMHFREGKPVSKLQIVDPVREGSGTTIRFKPDKKVFIGIGDKALPEEYFLDLLRRQAMLIDGLEIMFDYFTHNKPLRFYYEKGIRGFIDDCVESHKLLNKTAFYSDAATGTDDVSFNPEHYTVKMRLAFNFCRDTEVPFTELYHNNSFLFEDKENKTRKALENGFVAAVNYIAKDAGKLKGADKIVFKDIESILICVGATDAPGNRTMFKNQTKGAITNPFIAESFGNFVATSVLNFFTENKKEGDRVLSEILANKEAREAAEKVKKKVVQKLSKEVKFLDMPENFTDCKSKNVTSRELYIVEGRSAAGSVVQARFPDFQGVMPVRGKIINCLKEDITRVLNSDIIIDLFRILGCGIEVKNKKIEDLPKFDIGKLRWGKIIICADADVDGMQITCLILTMFYVLAPTLLKMGKVFIAETPLYEITYKDLVEFAFSEDEKEAAIERIVAAGADRNKLKISRSKGLGENNPDMMNKSTMHPLTRKLVPVTYSENEEQLALMFNALLGDDIESRRFMIEEYFDMYDDIA